jgi:hypothetical protein
MTRARSRLVVTLALVMVPLGGLALWRLQAGPPRSPANLRLDADRAGPLEGAHAHPPTLHASSVPKLLPATEPGEVSGTNSDEGPEPAAGVDDLDTSERAEIDRIEQAIRAEAGTVVGLSTEEREQLAAIRAEFDVRRRRFETQIDPATRMLERLASAAILGNARAERQQIGRALGRERAAALAEAERLAWSRVRTASPDAAIPRPGPAASRMLARRLSGSPARPIPVGP